MAPTGLRTNRLAVVLGAVCGFAACGPSLPDAELLEVSPNWGYNGEETPITIRGENLLPVVLADGQGERGGRKPPESA